MESTPGKAVTVSIAWSFSVGILQLLSSTVALMVPSETERLYSLPLLKSPPVCVTVTRGFLPAGIGRLIVAVMTALFDSSSRIRSEGEGSLKVMVLSLGRM